MWKPSRVSASAAVGVGLVCLLSLLACSVNVKKDEEGGDKNVDIRTPVGGIHVGKDVKGEDTGLAVYPGARRRENDDDKDKDENANVTLSFGKYGLKVVAVHYESDDPAGKVAAFYKDELKKYGNVLECHTHSRGGKVNVHTGKDSDPDSNQLKCEESDGQVLELKSGSKQNQRIVAIEPKGNVTSFDLVHVQIHGDDTI
jgi:hypothetical protein